MKKRYISNAVRTEIPIWLQQMIWYMWDVMEVPKRSCLQKFVLSYSKEGLRITHSQEQPEYCKKIETAITSEEGGDVCGTIFLIEEADSLTMLFVDE